MRQDVDMTITIDGLGVSAVMAWVGATTGIAALVWQVITWRRPAHRVKVWRAQTFLAYPGGGTSEAMVSVTARNVGASPVTVTNWGISLGKKEGGVFVPNPIPGSERIPHRLEAGAEMTMLADAASLAKISMDRDIPLRAMRCWVMLATGKTVYAKQRGLPIPKEGSTPTQLRFT